MHDRGPRTLAVAVVAAPFKSQDRSSSSVADQHALVELLFQDYEFNSLCSLKAHNMSSTV